MIRTSFACALALSLTATLAACGGDDGDDVPAIDAATVDTATTALTCQDYCTTILTNCTGDNTMYSNEAQCLASCSHWEEGTAGAMAGNTLGCRLYHAGVAAGNPDLHCKHAGPGGDATCGSDCEGFCTLVLGSCGPGTPYTDMASCMTTCATYPTTPPYSAAVTGGDSFSCRLYHATAASTAPATHCPHTGPDTTSTSQPCR